MRQAHPRIVEVGAEALAVSVGQAHQAQGLVAMGYPFPLLVDPEQRVVQALGLRRSWRGVLNPRGWVHYLGAIARGSRQGRVPWAGVMQMPGVAILDAEALPLWVHRGRTLGDYPPLSDVLERLRTLT